MNEATGHCCNDSVSDECSVCWCFMGFEYVVHYSATVAVGGIVTWVICRSVFVLEIELDNVFEFINA